jgi:hypothetical protein
MKSLLVFVGIITMIIPVSSYAQIFPVADAIKSQEVIGDEGDLVPNLQHFRENMKYWEDLYGSQYIEDLFDYYYINPDRDLPKPTDYKTSPEPKDDNNDLEKYCEGKGEWNGKKCVTINEEEQSAYEDAVCDDPGSNSEICDGSGNNDEVVEDENDSDKVTPEPEDESNDSDRKISFKSESKDSDSKDNDNDSDDNDNESEDNDSDDEGDNKEDDDDSGGDSGDGDSGDNN